MSLSKIKGIFNNLKKALQKPNSNIGLEINTSYGKIIDNSRYIVKSVATKQYRSSIEEYNAKLNEKLDAQYNEAMKQINKNIVYEKIDEKTFVNRLDEQKNKLTKNVKLIKKDDFFKNRKISMFIRKDYNKTKRILRTESHRVKEGVKNFFYKKFKIVRNSYNKKWKARFINTRHSHEVLHNQIADQNGLFWSESGYSAEYPGGFGIAKEDINCHCRVIFIKIKKE